MFPWVNRGHNSRLSHPDPAPAQPVPGSSRERSPVTTMTDTNSISPVSPAFPTLAQHPSLQGRMGEVKRPAQGSHAG